MAKIALQRNVELKARLASLEVARGIAEQFASQRIGLLEQTDTYFHCQTGRLKLRETVGAKACLIWYARPDILGPKASEYCLVPVENAEILKQSLAAALDIRCLVKKRREVYVYRNVRIHLDDVEELGMFLEFEAVLEANEADADGHAQVEYLTERFGIVPSDLLQGSYGEMMERHTAPRP